MLVALIEGTPADTSAAPVQAASTSTATDQTTSTAEIEVEVAAVARMLPQLAQTSFITVVAATAATAGRPSSSRRYRRLQPSTFRRHWLQHREGQGMATRATTAKEAAMPWAEVALTRITLAVTTSQACPPRLHQITAAQRRRDRCLPLSHPPSRRFTTPSSRSSRLRLHQHHRGRQHPRPPQLLQQRPPLSINLVTRQQTETRAVACRTPLRMRSGTERLPAQPRHHSVHRATAPAAAAKHLQAATPSVLHLQAREVPSRPPHPRWRAAID